MDAQFDDQTKYVSVCGLDKRTFAYAVTETLSVKPYAGIYGASGKYRTLDCFSFGSYRRYNAVDDELVKLIVDVLGFDNLYDPVEGRQFVDSVSVGRYSLTVQYADVPTSSDHDKMIDRIKRHFGWSRVQRAGTVI